jgi:hypothetical protein
MFHTPTSIQLLFLEAWNSVCFLPQVGFRKQISIPNTLNYDLTRISIPLTHIDVFIIYRQNLEICKLAIDLLRFYILNQFF